MKGRSVRHARVILARVLDQGPAAGALVLLWRAPDAATAAFLAALLALGVRSLLRVFVDRGSPLAVDLARLFAGTLGLAAGAALTPLAVATIPASRAVILAGALAFVMVVASAGLPGRRASAVSALAPPLAMLGLTGIVAALLLPAGLLRVETGQPAVRVVLTGEGRREILRWAPPGLPLREEGFRAHHLELQRPDGTLVGEAWLLGSSGVLGGVAFCAPAGAPCLLQLDSLRNDAPAEAGRARLFPPRTVVVEAYGPAVVPEWWRVSQQFFLRGLGLARREVSSAPLPLLDDQGLPLQTAYPLTVREKRLAPP